jgi:hypothetical protein
VAFTTLCAVVEPRLLVRMFWIPAAVITARTAPPAMTPVPSEAGFSRTMPDPNWPVAACGMVKPFSVIGTLTTFFLAASTPFLMAEETSRALPMP